MSQNIIGEDVAEQATLLPKGDDVCSIAEDNHFATRIKLYAIVLCANLSYAILRPTQTKIYEQIYCRQWYDKEQTTPYLSNGDIPEHLCKIAPVQKQVASLIGWLQFYDSIPGLIMIIPLGVFLDTVGRRPLFVMTTTVLALQQYWISFVMASWRTIPLTAIWLQAILNFFIGGKTMANVTISCAISDITPSSQIATTFFRFFAIEASSKILGPTIATGLMRIDPWWAISLGMVIQAIMVGVTVTVPETLTTTLLPPTSDETSQRHEMSYFDRFKIALHKTAQAFTETNVIWKDWRLLFLLVLSPLRMMILCLDDLVQRYVSNRFGWSLADATFLYTLQAIASTLVLLTVLPAISNLLEKKFGYSSIKKNMFMARAALLVLVPAYLIEGSAFVIPLFIIGICIETLASGISASVRALIIAMVEQKDNGRVLSVLAISEALSLMLVFPMTAWLFSTGIDKGGGLWLGLPFFAATIAALLGFVALVSVRFE